MLRSRRRCWPRMAIKQFGIMDGVARLVRKETEGSSTVLRFRLDRADGILIPIELRGDDIRGDLESGDKVEIFIKEKDADDTAIRLKRILNLSTGYNVQVLDRSRSGRIGSFVSENASTAAIAALVTAGVSFLLTHLGGTRHNQSPIGARPIFALSNGQVWALYAALAVLFNVAVFIILYWQLRHGNKKRGIKRRLWPYLRSRHMLAISVGLLTGEILTTLILWITHTAL